MHTIWHYNIFLDLEGHRSYPAVAKALDEVRKQAGFFKVLVSYPQAVV